MSCSRFDADLLMLVHRELEGGRSIRLRAHLLLCPGCRARLVRFRAISGEMSVAFRNPTLGVRVLGAVPRRAWLSLGALGTLIGLLAVLSATGVSAEPQTPVAVPTTIRYPSCPPCPMHVSGRQEGTPQPLAPAGSVRPPALGRNEDPR